MAGRCEVVLRQRCPQAIDGGWPGDMKPLRIIDPDRFKLLSRGFVFNVFRDNLMR